MTFCRVLAQFAASQVFRLFFAGTPRFYLFKQLHLAAV
jgi:hypothetical protein